MQTQRLRTSGSVAWAGEERSACKNPLLWIGSLFLHSLLLGLLCCWQLEIHSPRKFLHVISEIPDSEPEELVELQLEDDIDLMAPVSLSSVSQSNVSEMAKAFENPMDPSPDSLIDSQRERALLRPLAHRATNLSLGQNIDGLRGSSVNAGSDAGSITRITLEILRQLEKSKVLVVWVLDASNSLRMRREQVIARFERIYHELDFLEQDRNDALLTGVVAFGKDTEFMTRKPTADREAILEAVRVIEPDESGEENVFTAIAQTVLTWRKFRAGGRKMMIIVLTDEAGDDATRLEETIKVVQRQGVPVYVMGPIAPFGRRTVIIDWTDPSTGEVIPRPVDRGPETARIEYAILPHWYAGPRLGLFRSGFGPYALTRIARESGGIFFLDDDQNLPGPKFAMVDLLRYTPDYVAPAEYSKLVANSPLRKAILTVTEDCNRTLKQPPVSFYSGGIQFAIRNTMSDLSQTFEIVDRSLRELEAVEEHRQNETSKRWQAHYDLLMGRLLANKVRFTPYVGKLEEMYRQPKECSDRTKNAWELIGDENFPLGKPKKSSKKGSRRNAPTIEPEPGSENEPPPPASSSDADLARKYLEKTLEENPGTPWALLAMKELQIPLGFEWREKFMMPPAGEKLPWDKVPFEELTEKEKMAKATFEARMKERQKQRTKRAQIKKKAPNL